MKNRKTLVVMGRDSSTDDVKLWLEQGIIEQINTDSLWKVEVLNTAVTNADIGILKFSDLFNFEIQQRNAEFFEKVGFCIYRRTIEASGDRTDWIESAGWKVS